MEEIWHDIEGYEGLYQVSNKGHVKSLYNGSERILKSHDNGAGYLKVVLYKNTAAQHRLVYCLVSEVFIFYL